MNLVFLVFGRVWKTFIFWNKNKIESPKSRLVMESFASQHYKSPCREHMCHGRNKLFTFPNFRNALPYCLPNLIVQTCKNKQRNLYRGREVEVGKWKTSKKGCTFALEIIDSHDNLLICKFCLKLYKYEDLVLYGVTQYYFIVIIDINNLYALMDF